MVDDLTPTITEQDRKALEERQSALAAAAAAVKDGVADYNTCLAALQEVASAIAARLRADYEAGSPALTNRGALIAERNQAQIVGERLIASVQLIKALGGGWDEREIGMASTQ